MDRKDAERRLREAYEAERTADRAWEDANSMGNEPEERRLYEERTYRRMALRVALREWVESSVEVAQ